jgi:hypothetical protein
MTRFITAVLLASLTACTPKVQTSPLPESLTDSFGCSRAQIEEEWALRRFQSVDIGSDACVLWGRFGTPEKNTTMRDENGSSVILMWSKGHTIWSSTIRNYANTAQNQRLGRVIGKWTVGNFTVTNF